MTVLKIWGVLLLLFIPMPVLSAQAVTASTGPTIDSLYPGLATDVLKFATLAKLGKGTLLTAGNLVIRESEVLSDIKKANPAIQETTGEKRLFHPRKYRCQAVVASGGRQGRLQKSR